jgi:hypothetical protein
MSATTGTETASTMRLTRSSVSVIVSRPRSGMPSVDAEIPNPEVNTTGNPACSISFADRTSWAPGSTTMPGSSISLRSRATLVILEVLPGDADECKSAPVAMSKTIRPFWRASI